jgi:IS30 family transposase
MTIGKDKIIEIQNKLNSRPRKRYNYETPIFVMESFLFSSEVEFSL